MPSRLGGFHEGEVAMHQMLKVPTRLSNPTSAGLPMQYGMRVMASPLVALGTLDAEGRPWTTLWGGERGFAQLVATDVLGMNSKVDMKNDPVASVFWAGSEGGDGSVVQPGGEGGKTMAALAIDLETRDRVKLAGRMIAGADTGDGGIQMAMHVTESLGNCPKYLNKKTIQTHDMMPELRAEGLPLTDEALNLIEGADMFFISSTDGKTMDTNHRGGTEGFVRVLRNDEGGVVLIYPEYSGNRLYQTLGNLKVNPLVGIVIPDFVTSDVLYLTGSASILVGQEASSLLARTSLAVQITVTDARLVKSGLPFRGTTLEASPYNPPVRHLHAEHDAHVTQAPITASTTTATLTKREILTASIARFTFSLSDSQTWRAGQYVTLDFAEELDGGYSHMRDEDPLSLNDDFVRTFTVSSLPGDGREMQVTARRNGPATGFLWRANVRAGIEVPVLGFGGSDSFQMAGLVDQSEGHEAGPVFVAGGVGITPLLAQARGLLDAGEDMSVLWSLRGEDIALAVDSFERINGLADVTSLFVTGEVPDGMLERVKGLGGSVERRRMGEGDVDELKGHHRRFFLCAGPGLLRLLNQWLDGEEVTWEDFGY